MGLGVKIAVLCMALVLIAAAGCNRLQPQGERTDMNDPAVGEDPDELKSPDQIAEPGGVADPGEAGGNGSPKEPGDPDETVSSPGSGETEGEAKQDSGTYNGQIDPHSIEIQISGVPPEADPQAFQLSTGVQEEFAGYGFEAGDQVKFSYIEEEHGPVLSKIIIEIEKIKD